MKRYPLRVLALLLLAVAVVVPVGAAFGDVGGFSGKSDYSSGSSSSSSSSSGEGIGDLLYLIFAVALADGRVSGGEIAVGLIILAVAGFALHKIGGHSSSSSSSKREPVHIQDAFDVSRLYGTFTLNQRDPLYSDEAIREKISNWYVQMQNAWTDGDFSPMRPYFSDALFAQFDRQLDALNKQGLTNYVDRIAVLGVSIDGWYEEAGEEKLVATVSTRICDYTVDRNGDVVSGSRSDEKFMTYRYILARTVGTLTEAEGAMKTVNCPNCAAPLNINNTAVCPYCDSVVTAESHDWVISAIQGLSQRTV